MTDVLERQLDESTQTIALQLDHVSLFVRDRDASARFYSEVLGLSEIENRTQLPHIRWFALGSGRSIHLIGGAGEPPAKRPLATHLALATSNFDAMKKRLDQRGIRYRGLNGEIDTFSVRADGVRQLYFQDPDGHWVEINDTPPE
jgi:lactoylglutathione lyase